MISELFALSWLLFGSQDMLPDQVTPELGRTTPILS